MIYGLFPALHGCSRGHRKTGAGFGFPAPAAEAPVCRHSDGKKIRGLPVFCAFVMETGRHHDITDR